MLTNVAANVFYLRIFQVNEFTIWQDSCTLSKFLMISDTLPIYIDIFIMEVCLTFLRICFNFETVHFEVLKSPRKPQ